MMYRALAIAAVVALGLLSIGCADTCKEMCRFAADYYDDCLPEWNSDWENLGYDSKADFRTACIDSANTGRSQVSDCCPVEDAEAACDALDTDDVDGCVDEKTNECENNTLLAIDRNCEDTKESFRQSCTDYWQSVYVIGGPAFPEDNPTCQDLQEEEGGDDDGGE